MSKYTGDGFFTILQISMTEIYGKYRGQKIEPQLYRSLHLGNSELN